MILHNTDREVWLEERRKGIAASDVAAILGLSPWETPYSLWARKVGLIPEQDASDAMEFGLRAEAMLKAYFEDRTGLWVIGEQTIVTHPEYAWVRATLDGYVVERHTTDDPTEAIAVAEFKTTSEPEWDEVPAHYACQATWQMLASGVERVMFGVLHMAHGRPRFKVYEFERDEADIAYVLDACRRFWMDNVSMGLPPAVDGSETTTAAIVHANPEPSEAQLEADDRARVLVERIRNLKADAERAEEAWNEARNELRLLLADHEALVDPLNLTKKGEPKSLATFRTVTSSDIDVVALRAEMPDIAAQFTRTKTTRTLRVN